jgi:hypothetical protein
MICSAFYWSQRLSLGRPARRVAPADIPVEQPTKVELAANLKKMLGLTIPTSLLATAGARLTKVFAVDQRPRARRYPLLALSGHSIRADECPLSAVKRTSRIESIMSAFDPKRTSNRKVTAKIDKGACQLFICRNRLMRINLSPEANGTDLGLKGFRPAVISKSEKWFVDVA